MEVSTISNARTKWINYNMRCIEILRINNIRKGWNR